ncbi:MAG TPA: KH domain-containing protein [Acidimicrobiales bacterium]|nr:KH domain-containing protein [Acidimicrobiales bacterium]
MTNSSSDSSLFEGPDFSSSVTENDVDAGLDDDLGEDLDEDLDDGFGGGLDARLDDGPDVGVDGIDVASERANIAIGGTAQAVLEHIARQIVDDPDAVVVDAGPGRNGLKLSLHVDPADMGRIIGKRGRVAQALRTVVRAAGARDGADASVDIVD